MKTCPRCHETKQFEQFRLSRRGTGERRGYCNDCDRAYIREYLKNRRLSDPTFIEAERKRAENNRQNSKPYRITQMFHSIKSSANKRGISISVCRAQIAVMVEIQSWKCSKTGIPFDLTAGKGKRPFGPTIDRKDNSRGYEPDNIQIVCNIYNMAKNEFTADDVVVFARALLANEKAG